MTASSLNRWFLQSKRFFPWRENPTPYAVLVSEVMLQQTRADVVVPYFKKWMRLFPDVGSLAKASLEQVIKAWEGLGYYSRARNLHKAAQQIVEKYQGKIPCSQEALLDIPGLGPYTVGAILSFGFKQKALAIDGNVNRVVARFIGITEEITKASARSKVESFLRDFLDPQEPWVTAEGMIELGATVCTKTPQCLKCPLQSNCHSFLKGDPVLLPILRPSPKTKLLIRGVAVIEAGGTLLIRKNDPKEVMGDLWEFPYFPEKRSPLSIRKEAENLIGQKLKMLGSLEMIKHSFTRFDAHLFPFLFECPSKPLVEGYTWVSLEQIQNLPFSSGHKKILHLRLQKK